MRIKRDFITNSSTTSFVAWGISGEELLENEDVIKKIYDYYKSNSEENEKIISFEEFKGLDRYDFVEYLYNMSIKKC